MTAFIISNKHFTVKPIQKGKKNKGLQIEKAEQKLSLFVDDMITHVKITNKRLKHLKNNEFKKVTRYKINIKSVIFLCTSNE